MEIKYSGNAAKGLKKIYWGDREAAGMIMTEIERYAGNPTGNFDVKVLKGKYGDFKRLRVGRYRVIFEDTTGAMLIYRIAHRKEAYRD